MTIWLRVFIMLKKMVKGSMCGSLNEGDFRSRLLAL